MKEYKLLNFDVGISPQFSSFSVGPYQIILSKNYDKLRQKLERGVNVVTAYARCKDEEQKAILTSNPNENGIWDLCFILSFLLGRRFSLPSHEFHFTHYNRKENIVELCEMPEAANIAWENRCNLRNEKRPFWYYLGIIDTPIIQYQALYGCIALEIIQKVEVKSITVSKELEKLIEDVKNLIKNSKVEEELKCNLKSTTGNWGKTYVAGLKQLLMNYKIVSSGLSGTPEKRIKFINKVRNDIIHGNVPEYPNWIVGDEKVKEKEYVFICIDFIPSLVKECLIRSFGLLNFYTAILNRENLQKYIYHGKWEGRRIDEIISKRQKLSM